MDLTELLALPGCHYLRVQVGPAFDDTVDVDRVALDARGESIKKWCLSLEVADGTSWKELTRHTDGNGVLAKLLVALGDAVGAWRSLPLPGGLWTSRSPVVSLLASSKSTKPSAGALEPVGLCECCRRPVGPEGSILHDLRRAEESDLCEECVSYGCTGEGRCLATDPALPKKREAATKRLEEYEPSTPPSGVDAYLRSIN